MLEERGNSKVSHQSASATQSTAKRNTYSKITEISRSIHAQMQRERKTETETERKRERKTERKREREREREKERERELCVIVVCQKVIMDIGDCFVRPEGWQRQPATHTGDSDIQTRQNRQTDRHGQTDTEPDL